MSSPNLPTHSRLPRKSVNSLDLAKKAHRHFAGRLRVIEYTHSQELSLNPQRRGSSDSEQQATAGAGLKQQPCFSVHYQDASVNRLCTFVCLALALGPALGAVLARSSGAHLGYTTLLVAPTLSFTVGWLFSRESRDLSGDIGGHENAHTFKRHSAGLDSGARVRLGMGTEALLRRALRMPTVSPETSLA
ncbi:unnamed protein product [Peniophora sp. CBMAI 1063]|nr:unnamed protein product [Peniophora sp. CBMAI 1063]